MTVEYLTIGYGQLFIAGLLILINIGLSVRLKLGLERQMSIAVVRMVVQLTLMGYLLRWIFTWDNPWMILALGSVMSGIASVSAVNRTKRRFPGVYWNSFLSVWSSAFLVTLVTMIGVLQVDPWYTPRYLIPIWGMVLGNMINGISLALDRFMEDLAVRKDQVEVWLALGATRWEAARDSVREAARTGMIPIINTMLVLGIVSLPGMITGQILAGADPAEATNYQITIFFVIASAVALCVTGMLLLAFSILFNGRHQLCTNRLRSSNG